MSEEQSMLEKENETSPNKKQDTDHLFAEIKKIKFLAVFSLIIALGSSVVSYSSIQSMKTKNDFENKFFELTKRLEETEGKIEENNDRVIRMMVEDIFPLKSEVFPSIRLSEETLQDIDWPFSVCDISLEPHLAGVKIRGHIVNASSVSYEGAKFKITLDEHYDDKWEIDQEKTEKEFWVKKIGAGSGADFGLFIDGVDPQKCKSGEIEFLNGTVVWHKEKK